MSGEIIAAIISASAVLIASIIAAIVQKGKYRRTKKYLDQVEAVIVHGSESIREDYIGSCGYKTNVVSMKMRMINLQGNTEVITSHQGFKVIKKDWTITHIPGAVWVGHPDGHIDELPHLTSPPSLLTKAVELDNVNISKDGKKCSFDIEITGGLTCDDPPLDFEDRTVLSKGVCVTKEEMEETYKSDEFKKEYHSFDAIVPMDYLIIEIEFPEGYHVQSYPIVFYLESEIVNNKELDRVKSDFQRLTNGARFKVAKPLMNFRYAIYWIPPTAREVEHLLEQ